MAEGRRKSIGIVVGCILLFAVFALNLLLYASQNTKIVNENIERRKATELSSCIAYNVRSQSIRTALKNSLFALVKPGTVLNDEQKAQIAAYNAAVDAQLPYRECTPEAITYYIEHPPADPAITDRDNS